MDPLSIKLASCLPPQGTEIDLPQVVLSTMRYVENAAAVDNTLHGTGKMLLFKSAISDVIRFACSQQLISKDDEHRLLQWVTNGSLLIESMVDAFITVSKNPQMIQLTEAVKTGCVGVCKSKKRN